MNTRYVDSEFGNYLLKLHQPISGGWADELEKKFRDLFDRGVRRVVLNLEDVPLIDGRGLAALVAGLEIFGNRPQNLQLIAPQAQPQLVLELTGFDKIFAVHTKS